MSKKRMAPEVKKATGSYKSCPSLNPDNADCPKANGQVPDMPDWFDEDEREKWVDVVDLLKQMNVMSSDTREIVTSYCIAYAGFMRARRIVEKDGELLTDDKGKPYRHPILVELHKWRDQMNRLLPEFGLTPASRSKLSVISSEVQENPFENILSRLTSNNN